MLTTLSVNTKRAKSVLRAKNDSNRDMLLCKTHLYNVTTGQFDEVGVLVDTGSNAVFVDSAYCANKQPCNPLHVTFMQGGASYS